MGGKIGKIHPFGPIISDMWFDIHRVRHRSNRDAHPCQLPVPLLERIILMSSDEKDIIFDPFMGTGTTGIAAKKLGRRFVGVDKESDYCDIAVQKLAEVNPSMFEGVWASYHLKELITIRDVDWKEIKKYFEIPSDKKQLNLCPITPKRELIL